MTRFVSASRIARPAIVLAAALAVAFAVSGCGLLGSDAKPSDPPDPTAAPTATPTTTATPTPTDTPAGGPFTVGLDIADDHDVSVTITDKTGTLRTAITGRAGDGMSVRWGDWKAENVDASTIRLTWVGLPRDEALTLSITEAGGTYQLDLVQAAPPADSDAVGFDRVLVLTFDAAVSADDVEVVLEESAA